MHGNIALYKQLWQLCSKLGMEYIPNLGVALDILRLNGNEDKIISFKLVHFKYFSVCLVKLTASVIGRRLCEAGASLTLMSQRDLKQQS